MVKSIQLQIWPLGGSTALNVLNVWNVCRSIKLSLTLNCFPYLYVSCIFCIILCTITFCHSLTASNDRAGSSHSCKLLLQWERLRLLCLWERKQGSRYKISHFLQHFVVTLFVLCLTIIHTFFRTRKLHIIAYSIWTIYILILMNCKITKCLAA